MTQQFHSVGIYPKISKTLVGKDVVIPLFITVSFTIAKTWKQPTWPLADEWIKGTWHNYTVECSSAARGDKILPLGTAWTDPEYRAKWSQSDWGRQVPRDSAHTWNLKNNITKPHHRKRLTGTENRLIVGRRRALAGWVTRVRGWEVQPGSSRIVPRMWSAAQGVQSMLLS